MANEAKIIQLLGNGGDPVSFTIDDAASVAKGALLAVYDERTASGANLAIVSGPPFAGIAAHEKVAGDGSTQITCYTHGIFDLTNAANPAITSGAMVCLSGVNLIRACVAADLLTGAVVGKCLGAAAASEVIQVLVGGP